jgi:hypothetical protein
METTNKRRNGMNSKMAKQLFVSPMSVLLSALLVLCGCTGLQVKSNPAGAQVIMDGTNTGKVTPAKLLLRDLPRGEHTVTVQKEGYDTVTPPCRLEVKTRPGSIVNVIVASLIITPVLAVGITLCDDQFKGVYVNGDFQPRELKQPFELVPSKVSVPAAPSVSTQPASQEAPQTNPPATDKH